MLRAPMAVLMVLPATLAACTINIGTRNQPSPTPSSTSSPTATATGASTSGPQQIVGSGKVAAETRQVSGFNRVLFRGPGSVIIDRTGIESLSIEAEDNILPVLTSEVIDGVLNLGQKPGTGIVTYRPIIYRVSAKDLIGIEGTGSGTADVKGVDTATFTSTTSGSIQVTVAGKATDHKISISGSGQYNAESLAARYVQIEVSGSAGAVVNAAESLNATISGSGSVIYTGSPAVSQTIRGSGTIQKK